MNFKMNSFQIIIAVLFLTSSWIVTVVAIVGFSILNLPIPYLKIIVQIWIVMQMPLAVYVGIFTKFNNPFKKVDKK